MSQPPSTGPSAAVMAVNPDQVPMARPRFSRGNDGADERQAAGDEKRRADALKSARGDELVNRAR